MGFFRWFHGCCVDVNGGGNGGLKWSFLGAFSGGLRVVFGCDFALKMGLISAAFWGCW